jgi:hypothetical protein
VGERNISMWSVNHSSPSCMSGFWRCVSLYRLICIVYVLPKPTRLGHLERT